MILSRMYAKQVAVTLEAAANFDTVTLTIGGCRVRRESSGYISVTAATVLAVEHYPSVAAFRAAYDLPART